MNYRKKIQLTDDEIYDCKSAFKHYKMTKSLKKRIYDKLAQIKESGL